MATPEVEILTNFVSRILQVDDVTMGNPKEWIVRYRGRLLNEDSAAAYDQLEGLLKPYDLTPLFRNAEDGRHVILLAPSMHINKFKPNFRLAFFLFVLTAFSVMLMGVEVSPDLFPDDQGKQILFLLENIFSGWPFALSMMGILFAHEMGHYLMCRYYKIPATPPYFLPLPLLSPLGTLGAFIMMRGIPKNKRILFDVGVAGPLAGLIVAIPVLFLGLSLSKPVTVIDNIYPALKSGEDAQCYSANFNTDGTYTCPNDNSLEGNSLFYLGAKYLVFKQLLPAPSNYDVNPVIYWLRYFFTGQPIPFGGMDVQISSVALAGWAGLLVTALNLIPVGTLDGGHVIYGLFGEKARKLFPYVIGALIILSFFSLTWLLWVAILFFLGRVQADPLDQITQLDAGRRALGIFMLIVFILVFTPIPWVTY